MTRSFLSCFALFLALPWMTLQAQSPQDQSTVAPLSTTASSDNPPTPAPPPSPTPSPTPPEPAPNPSPTPEDPKSAPDPNPIPPPGPQPSPIPPPLPPPEQSPKPQPEVKPASSEIKKKDPQLAVAEKNDLPTGFTNEPPPPVPDTYVPQTVFKARPKIDPHIKITKVHDFRNEDDYKPEKNDALMFEKAYWSYGAILSKDVENTHGQYFVITWVNKGPKADFTTKFEYRQVNTKALVRTLTLDHPAVRGATRSTFAVVGTAFKTYGYVYAWRFTVLRAGEVVAEDESFIW